MNQVSILVVDDDDDVRTALCDELSPQYAVTSAAGAVEAFAALAARRFDVIISDLRMPDHDGIEVLDFARDQQLGIIRILLTGYTDERARAALLEPDAPFKVGKPWYDEIEIVLTRALEQRRRTRMLTASLESAFSLGQIEVELADTHDLVELGEVVAMRAGMVTGVIWCGCAVDGVAIAGQTERHDGAGAAAADDWRLDLPIDGPGRLRMTAGGHGDETREVICHLAELARRRSGVLTAVTTDWAVDVDRPRRSRLDELLRQAAVGAMSGTLIHGVAGIMQSFDAAIGEIAELAEQSGDATLSALVADLATASSEGVAQFVEMRKFIRDGKPVLRAVSAQGLLDRTLRQIGGTVRERAAVRIASAPPVSVRATAALTEQVLSAVLRNAATASPIGGSIDVEILIVGDAVSFVITDDGPGVAPELTGMIFEAQIWQRPGGAGTGLAIAAHAIQAQGGSIGYRRAPGRGACFTITLPKA